VRGGLEGENQDDEGEAGSGDQDVTGLDVGVVGNVEEGRDQRPEEEDPAGEGRPRVAWTRGSGAGGTREGRGDGVLQGAADGGGPQQKIEDAGNDATEDEREAERVDGEETVETESAGPARLAALVLGRRCPKAWSE